MKSKPPDKEKAQDRAKRAALAALRRARRRAEAAGISLSDWEGEFLGSVEGKLEQYGSAFRDRDKGAAGEALSTLQGVKLKEIAAKARGKERKGLSRGSGFKRRD